MYYLETSSLRQLINKLDKIILKQCFTSVLSIIELISGIIDESEYQKRKNILQNIINKKIFIDFNFPDDIILKAFPKISFEEFRLNDLNCICKLILISNSLSDYYIKEKEITNLKYKLDYFIGYDKRYNSTFISSTINGNKYINELFETKPISSLVFSDEEKKLSKKEILNLWQNKYKDINIACTLIAIVKGYGKKNIYNNIDDSYYKQEQDIALSYNGSISFYIEIFSYYTMNKLIKSDQPKKNDIFDLQHFLYLRSNENIKIVSDDNLFYNICNELYPDLKILIKTNEFLKKMRHST